MESMRGTVIETSVKVLSWNLWWQFGDWQNRAPAIVQSLKSIDADIIGLQEVWGNDDTNFAAQLADKLGYHHVYAPGQNLGGVFMGNAILSRWPMVETESAPLYGEEGKDENRVVIYAKIDGPRGPIPAFSTHLNYLQEHSHIRQKQTLGLVEFIHTHQIKTFPPVLCGDFNADPLSEEIRIITGQTTCAPCGLVFNDAWAFSNPETPGFTWENTNPHVAAWLEPNRRIDYIFTGWPKAKGAGHITNCNIVADTPINGIWASDHHALLASLRY